MPQTPARREPVARAVVPPAGSSPLVPAPLPSPAPSDGLAVAVDPGSSPSEDVPRESSRMGTWNRPVAVNQLSMLPWPPLGVPLREVTEVSTAINTTTHRTLVAPGGNMSPTGLAVAQLTACLHSGPRAAAPFCRALKYPVRCSQHSISSPICATRRLSSLLTGAQARFMWTKTEVV